MTDVLQHRTVTVNSALGNKRRRVGKPWWSATLTTLWNELCEAEKDWSRCQPGAQKVRKKAVMVAKRKAFDREVDYRLQSADTATSRKGSWWISSQATAETSGSTLAKLGSARHKRNRSRVR